MKKRLAAMLLALCTLLSLLPVSALAKGGGGHGGGPGGPGEKPSETQTTTVYVYTKIEGMTDDELKDLTLNGHGWYTLGYVTVTYTGELTLDKVKAAMATSFTHEHNTSINISDVVFNSLTTADGADDYVASGTSTYHLDGKLTVTAKYGFVTVKHVSMDGASTLLNEGSVPYRAGTTLTFGRDYMSRSFSGYTYDHVSDSSYTVTADQNKTITLYYRPVSGLSYTVNYLEQGTNRVLHNAKTVEGTTHGRTYTENAETISGYTLVGASSQTITVTSGGENVLNFYYKKDLSQVKEVSYTVYYTVDGQPRPSETIVVTAKVWVGSDQLAIAEGGIPTPADKFPGCTLDPNNPAYPAAGTMVANGSEYTVNYVTRTDLTYTVRYLEQGTNKVLHVEKAVDGQTYGTTITERAVTIPGYLIPSEQTLTIGLEKNEITFYYQRNNGQTKSLTYKVQYYKDDQLQESHTLTITANVWINSPDTITIQDGSVFTDVNKYPGYQLDTVKSDRYETGDAVATGSVFNVYYTARTDLTYTVRYLEKGTDKVLADSKNVTGRTFGRTYTENAADIPGYTVDEKQKSVEITLGDNVVTFYYTLRSDLTYTVRYLEQGTDKVLADNKTVTGQTFNATVTESPIAIEGYTPVDASAVELTIGVEKNEIIFYYTARTDLSYTVRYLEQGTDKVLADNKTVTGQTFNATVTESPIAIEGYTPVDASAVELTIGLEGNVITFYYTVNKVGYTVKYVDENGSSIAPDKTGSDNFGTKITAESQKLEIPGYTYESGNDLTLSAKDSDNVMTLVYRINRYTVTYIINGVMDFQQTDCLYQSKQTVRPTPSKEGYTFEGWDTKDVDVENGEFTVTSNVTFTGTFVRDDSVTKTVQYIIRYTVNDQLHSTETVTDKVWINDPAELDIAEDGIPAPADKFPGYVLDPANPTYPAAGTKVASGTVYTVNYIPRSDLTYTVRYLEKDTDKVLKDAVTVSGQTFGTTVNVDAADIPGYIVDAAQKSVEITLGDNVVTFYYTARTDLSYTVRYLEQGTDKVLKDAVTVSGQTFGTTVNVDAADIPGYTVDEAQKSVEITLGDNVVTFYYTARTDLSYTVRYLEQGTNKVLKDAVTVPGQTFGTTVNVDAADIPGYTVDAAQKSVEISLGDNVATFYYTARTDLSYTVRYLEQGTDEVLADSKTATGQTFNATVAESPIAIEGYTPVDASSVELTIGVEKNEITFYYTANPVTPTDPVGPGPEEPVPPVTPDEPPVTPVTPTTPAAPVAPTTPDPVQEPQTPAADANQPGSPAEDIVDDETPLAGPTGGAWALLNLILTAVTVALSAVLLVGYLGKSKQAREDENDNTLYDEDGNEILEYVRKKRGFWRVVSLIPAIGAVIAFILTENMLLPMVIVDRWTLLMVAIALVQVVVTALSKKRDEEQEENSSAAC